VEAIKEAGHKPLVLDTLRCSLVVAPGAARLLYRGVEVGDLDAVIPRIGASITPYGLAVVSHLELMGVPVVNGTTAISRSRDKLRSLQLLSMSGIAVPRTVMAHKHSQVSRLVEEVGGLPVIIKLLRGTQGVGVMIAHTREEAQTIVQTFWDLGQEVMLQEFVSEAHGADVRVLVVGNEAVGAMRRQAKKGEFRSNIHRGGRASPVSLPPSVLGMAVKAAQVLGLGLSGVDLLESRKGYRVMEVNSSPGFEALEKATGRDIARQIVDYAGALKR
jgi:ribosomal protein S6--L-glutamate ligase